MAAFSSSLDSGVNSEAACCRNQAVVLRARFEVREREVEIWSSANDTNVTVRETGAERVRPQKLIPKV